MSSIEEARRLIELALDFWSAPGIDMPDIDTFDDMATFLEETGEPYQCKWDEDNNYIGEPIKPVGMTPEEHDNREKDSARVDWLDKHVIYFIYHHSKKRGVIRFNHDEMAKDEFDIRKSLDEAMERSPIGGGDEQAEPGE